MRQSGIIDLIKWNARRWISILRWRLGRRVNCWEPGCTFSAAPCYLEPYDKWPDDFYCACHGFEHGYCKGCGLFFGGIENFDFGDGFCDNCEAEIEEYDEEDDDYFPYEDIEDMP